MDKKNLVLGIVVGIAYIFTMIIWLLSVGSSHVASYEDYVIGGFGAFLIVENLLIPFFLNLVIAVGGGVVLMYRMLKNKKSNK